MQGLRISACDSIASYEDGGDRFVATNHHYYGSDRLKCMQVTICMNLCLQLSIDPIL